VTAPVATGPAVGDAAPLFTLPDTEGRPVALSDFRGGPVVLVFFPWAFSSVCTAELCTLQERLPEVQHHTATTLGVSCDARASLRAFAAAEGYAFPLLSDHWPHGEVSRRYGVFDDTLGAALRGTFVIDGAGVVRWRVVQGVPDARDLDAVLAGLQSAA